MSSISTESLSTRNENGMESLLKLIQLKSSTVLASAPFIRLKKRNRETRNGINTITDASTPAVMPFNLLKLKEMSRNPIIGKSGTSQIYSNIVYILCDYHFSLLSTLMSMV